MCTSDSCVWKTERFRPQTYEIKALRRIRVPRIDQNTEEWIQRHNLAHTVQLEELLKRIDILNEMKRKKLEWARRAWS